MKKCKENFSQAIRDDGLISSHDIAVEGARIKEEMENWASRAEREAVDRAVDKIFNRIHGSVNKILAAIGVSPSPNL